MSIIKSPIAIPPNLIQPPPGWQWHKLTDLARLESGHTPSRHRPDWWGGDVSWLSLTEIRALDGQWVERTQIKTNEAGIANSAARILPRGTVCFSRTASVGFVAIMAQPMATSQDFANWVCSENLDPEYLMFALISSRKNLRELATGATHKTIYMPTLKAFHLCAPAIGEQQQIVTRLKAQLAEVDKARQAVEAQLREAHTLYAAVLKETFLNGDSETWPKIGLGEVGDVVAGVTLGRKTNGKAIRPIPYLRVANVKDGHLDLSDVSIIEATEAEIERLRLQPGDILLTEGGDPDKLGRGTFWNGELDECIHQNHIFRVRFPSDSYLPEFIAAQIGSTYGKDYFFAHAKKTTGIATINQKVLKGFPVMSPSIEVQKGIMATLKSQLDETGRIIQSATSQLNDINLLPQKILAQAFEM